MRLMLIREGNFLIRTSTLAYGMGLIGTMAKEVAEVKILDNNTQHKHYSTKDLIREIQNFSPDVLGLSISCYNMFPTISLMKAVRKELPSICILGGGIHTYTCPDQVVEHGAHVVTKGDAELTILPVLKAIKENLRSCITKVTNNGQPSVSVFSVSQDLEEDLQKTPGIYWEGSADKVVTNTGNPKLLKDLDTLPFVDFDLFNLSDYIKNSADHRWITNILCTQRGCPYKCEFCQTEAGNGLTFYRENSADYKVEYLRTLYKKFKPDHFWFWDNNFTINRKKTIEFCEKLTKSELHGKFTYSAITSVMKSFDAELLANLKRSGCSELSIGVERLNLEALKKIPKNTNYEMLRNNMRMAQAAGLSVQANCLIGFPWDTPELIKKEIELFDTIQDDVQLIATSILTPLPGTPVCDYTDEKGRNWYLDPDVMNWKPSFYHKTYNHQSKALECNFFNHDKNTLRAIKNGMEEFYHMNIRNIGSKPILYLHYVERILAKISYALYKISPAFERSIFWLPLFLRKKFWNILVSLFFEDKKAINKRKFTEVPNLEPKPSV